MAYLNRLKDVPGDRFLLSEQMHHICNKFHSFVDKQGTFGKDEATFERLNQCVFSLLVAQPLVLYAKRFLRIGHCYWKMSNYFARIHCSGRKIYHNAARKIYEDALKISGEFVPTDPSAHSIRYLRYSISIAKLLKAGKFMREALETLIIGLSKAHRVKESNLGSEELVDIMWEANELLGKYMEELGV